jgi:hypothetical protein
MPSPLHISAASVGKVHFLRELVQSSAHKFENVLVQFNVHNSKILTKFTVLKNELVHRPSSFFQYVAVRFFFGILNVEPPLWFV